MNEPVILQSPAHPISRRDVDPDALRVIFRLHHSGFLAYLTGGAVRDLLLRRPPKDFDVVTDARPGQIRKRFANCYIIGRRFRLAHVRFPDGKTIEVATFRRTISPGLEETQPSEFDPHLLYGTPAEDARRRDLTINALFYDAVRNEVIDYVGGTADLEMKRVRVIGEPGTRYAEDPVRIWRVLRHASRLRFEIDGPTAEAIPAHGGLLSTCPGARLYEELNKDLLLETGPVFDALRKFGLLRKILGRPGEIYEEDGPLYARLRELLLLADQAKAAGEDLSLEDMYALVFWPWLEPLCVEFHPDLAKVLGDALFEAGMRTTIPRTMRANVVQILSLVSQMRRALRTGRWRHSLERLSHYGPASRLFILIDQGRFPEEGESFGPQLAKAFPGGPRLEKRRRRRRRKKRRPPEGFSGPAPSS